VSSSGSVLTFPGGTQLNLNRTPESKFQLISCAGGTGNGVYTYSTVDSFTQITAQETVGTASGCVFTDLSAGIRIILKTGGPINLSATFFVQGATPQLSHTNPNHDACNFNKVTDVAIDCDGNTQSPPLAGYLCQIGNWSTNRAGIYLIQDNGRVCMQSAMYNPVAGGYMQSMLSPWDVTNPKRLGMQNSGNLYTAFKKSS